MDKEAKTKIKELETELQYVCGYLFGKPPMITVDTSEDAPCVILDGMVCVCYTHVEGHAERMYEIQHIVVEHNYPQEPDNIDYVPIQAYHNKYSATLAVIKEWVHMIINMNWE